MNNSLEDALSLTSEVVNMVRDEVRGDVEVVLCTPYIYLPVLQKYVQEVDRISLGAQNCHHKASGAFTGEISASMLAAIEVPYVIIGHSERRQYFGETDALITDGGALEVGKSSTKAVVMTSILILIFNLILTQLFLTH